METEKGALAGPDSGQPYRDIKKLGEGPGVVGMKVGCLCWGGSGPAWGRQAGLEEHLSWEAGLRQSSHPGAPQAVCASSSPGCG